MCQRKVKEYVCQKWHSTFYHFGLHSFSFGLHVLLGLHAYIIVWYSTPPHFPPSRRLWLLSSVPSAPRPSSSFCGDQKILNLYYGWPSWTKFLGKCKHKIEIVSDVNSCTFLSYYYTVFWGRHQGTHRAITTEITEDDITSQHSDILAMCCTANICLRQTTIWSVMFLCTLVQSRTYVHTV